MSKRIRAGLLVATALPFFFLMRSGLPKYQGFLLIFFLAFSGDIFFGFWLNHRLKKSPRFLRILVAVSHWLVYLLVAVTFLSTFIHPFSQWNIPFRTYLFSLAGILFFTKLPPLAGWLIYQVIYLVKTMIPNDGNSWPESKKIPVWLKSSWVLSLLIFSLLTYGMMVGQHQLVVKTTTLKLKDLPASMNGYRVVQFSDLHLGSCTSKEFVAELVEKINSLKPDLVLFSGDIFNYRSEEGAGYEKILGRISAKDGVFAVLGNHDYGDYSSWPGQEDKKRNFRQGLLWYQSSGWILLRNEHRIIRRGADSIALIGVENWGATRRFQRRGNLVIAMKGIENVPFQMLISHDPSHWDSIVSRKYPRVDITFSGHTHGGQFGMVSTAGNWSPIQWSYPHWMGLYEKINNGVPQYLYVNPGCGTIGYAGRIGILPEISLLVCLRP